MAWWYRYVPVSDIGEAVIRALGSNADEPMNVADLEEATDEKKGKLREVLRQLESEGRVKKMNSIAGPGGSTGFRYRLPTDESASTGGLSL
jgi:hypothetical protein